MKTKDKVELMVKLFQDAAHAAAMADPGQDNDGGTCNLDSPAFRVDRMRESTIQAAADKAQIRIVKFSWFGGQRWYWLGVPRNGQANRRSSMSTAASHVLRKFAEANIIPGFQACQYCAMD